MNYIRNGVIVLPDRLVTGCVLEYDDRIRRILPDDGSYRGALDACGGFVSPGFIDLHIHGYKGCDASDGDADGIVMMARQLPENGVTAFYPTVMTLGRDELTRALASIRGAMAELSGGKCARVPGAHMEGPFLNPKRAGAQDAQQMRPVSAEFLREWSDVVRIVTIAPELPGAATLIEQMGGEILLSVGHSDAAFPETVAAFDAGARHATHLFNAMSGLHHRTPGVAAAALSDDRVSCELIADGHHVSPELFPMIRRMKGEKLVLVTDCTRAGGMGEGEYMLGGNAFTVRGGRCLLPDGTLSGSVLRMNEAVRNLAASGASVQEAIYAASLAPARAVGIDGECGSIEPGKRADLTILSPDFQVQHTVVGGEFIFENIRG